MKKTKTLINLIKDKVDTLPPEQSFLSDLKATVSACNPPRKRSAHVKPSSLNCLRLIYFDKIQAPIDAYITEYSSQRICETGTNSHEAIQYYVTQMKVHGKDCTYIDVEQFVKERGLTYLEIKRKSGFETHLYDTRYDISFLCDGIILYKGNYYILEIKTETDLKGMDREGADPSHRRQSICYSLSLGINKVMWLYEERNFCVPKTFLTTVTEQERVQLIMDLEFVEQCVKDLNPPPKCTSRKYCQYCNYKTICKQFRE